MNLVTSIILIVLSGLIIKGFHFGNRTQKSYGLGINITTIILMLIGVIFCNLGSPLLVSNTIDSLADILVVIIGFFTVGLVSLI